MIVKICGVKSLEELEIVEKYADYAGVVVKSNSRRCVELEVAREIMESSSIPVFAVSTSKTFAEWEEIVTKTECKFAQVHAEMSLEDFEKLKEIARVMKAFIVNGSAEDILRQIEFYSPHYILLDSGCGSGKVHDWSVSREIARKFAIFLAGGLNGENVERAIRLVRPAGVDVSSGVERNGFKDEELVRIFVRRAKNVVR